ncbi:MAG: response regulator transcription factor [Pseudomonadota bacterium]
MSVTVLLAEDHAMVRSGLKSLLADTPHIEVVGEASNGRQALQFVRQTPVDVVVMDITMPGLNGLEATSRLSKSHPDVKVLMLSMFANEEHIVQALRHGACGYLVKDAAASELELAINTVARGDRYLGNNIDAMRVLRHLESPGGGTSSLDRLTPRQREILQLVVEGNKTREIADMLAVSVKTVETHRAQLMDRLGIRDVAGLVKYSIRVGLLSAHS